MKWIFLTFCIFVPNEMLFTDNIVKPHEYEAIVVTCLKKFFNDNKNINFKGDYSFSLTFNVNEYVNDTIRKCIFVKQLETETIPVSDNINKLLAKYGVHLQPDPDGNHFPHLIIDMCNSMDKDDYELEIGCLDGPMSGIGEVFQWQIVNNKVRITQAHYVQY